MEYVSAKKRLGQNFLTNEEILKDIASSTSISDADMLIEIGPGMGALTKYLVTFNSYFVAYEIDLRMKPYLEKFEGAKSKVFYGDFLKRDVGKDIQGFSYQDLYVIANIPYYITSPILSKLISLEEKPKEIVLLVQKEFGERIVACENQKEYNAFTLFVDLEYEASILFFVNRNHFVPAPNVDSVVIKLVRKDVCVVEDREFYLKFVGDAFRSKRKTLKNNMKMYDFLKIKEILSELGYKENVRAEEISKEDFKVLVNRYRGTL